jgi:hypothetical protein
MILNSIFSPKLKVLDQPVYNMADRSFTLNAVGDVGELDMHDGEAGVDARGHGGDGVGRGVEMCRDGTEQTRFGDPAGRLSPSSLGPPRND